MRILSADWVLPVEGEPIENGAVVIEDGGIAAVGTARELGEGERFADSAIVPGFVNAHTHLEYAVYAGFGDGLSFGPWISTHVERKSRLERADMEAIARLGAAECLRSGITTVGDLAFTGASAHACADLGLRAIVYLEVFGKDGADALRQFEEKRAYVAPALSERVRVGVSPHAPYTCSREVYAAAMGLGLPVATHLNESQDELDWLLRGEGPWQPLAEMLVEPEGTSGIRSLAAAGLLDERVAAAHCVKVDEEEIGLLAGHGVAVTHCPRSNALLGCGIAPLAELRAAGIRIGIGTDGVSSVPSHDFFEELRTVISFARAQVGAGRRAVGDSGAGARHPRRRPRPRARRGDRLARPGQAGRPRPWSRFPALRIYHGRIRRQRWSTADHRSESRLPWSTAKPDMREEEANVTS